MYTGSAHPAARRLTAAMIDSRDFIAAKRRAETEILLPSGPKIALTGGLGLAGRAIGTSRGFIGRICVVGIRFGFHLEPPMGESCKSIAIAMPEFVSPIREP
mgnify:CR=1 FL=1